MQNIFKPILFSTPMVQAILNGTKILTRRIVSPQPYKEEDFSIQTDEGSIKVGTFLRHPKKGKYDGIFEQDAPKLWPSKYQKGDILWVRETWSPGSIENSKHTGYRYKADDENFNVKWKPSIFMPRGAARIFLYVTNVRAERLQDISETDAIAEGVLKDVTYQKDFKSKMIYRDYTKEKFGCLDAKSSFMTLWISINGKESWNKNPYVWVYEYERIEKPKNF